MFEEDLSAFLNVEEHADEIVVRKNNRIINGIIDKEYIETNDMQGYNPVLTCKTLDLSSLTRGDIIERGKEIYTFIYQEPDGTGMSRVILEEVSA